MQFLIEGRSNARRVVGLAARYALFAAFGSCIAIPVYAQKDAYPVKPIRLVIPFSPGGTTDTPWRIVAPKLAQELGGEIFIDNRPGAGASIGAALVAQAPSDGYTLLGTSNSHAVTAALYKVLPYDAIADFIAVAQIASTCQVLVTHPSLPVKSVQQLVSLAKSQPGKLDYSSPGTGTTPHLFFALFSLMTNIDMLHVPYKGLGLQLPDLVAGRVPTGFVGVTAMLPYWKAKRLRALAVSCSKRTQFLPGVPTMHEAGVKGYQADQLAGMLAPKGVNMQIVQRLEAALQKATAMRDVQEAVMNSGNEVDFESGKQFGAMMKSEADRWRKVVREAGITVN